MISSNKSILCIDEKNACQLYETLFSRINQDVNVTFTTSQQEAINFIKSWSFDLYILEPYLSEIEFTELCRMIRKKDPQTPILFYSGISRKVDRALAMAAGATAFLVKANDFDKFIETVGRFLKKDGELSSNTNSH
jgi:two-component system alkaline phosphatase synthesis response regulator PhoP